MKCAANDIGQGGLATNIGAEQHPLLDLALDALG